MNPHEWDVDANWWSWERGQPKEGELMVELEATNYSKLLLVHFVSAMSPSICLINNLHLLKLQQVDTSRTMKLFPHVRSDCT
jgi:hypothetical protein